MLGNMNSLVLPSRDAIWRVIGTELADRGFPPAIWFGPRKLSEFAHETFPGCEVINYRELHAGVPNIDARHVAPAEYLRSPEFAKMKLQVFKLMDRQDDTRSFGRLEREANFYGMFNYLYSLIIEKNIMVVLSCESPHGPGYLIAYRICEWLKIPTYHLVRNSYVPLVHVSKHIVGPPLRAVNAPPVDKHFAVLDQTFASYADGIPTPHYMKSQADFDREYNFPREVLKHGKRWLYRNVKTILGIDQRPSDDIVRHARFPYERNALRLTYPFIVRNLRRNLHEEYAKHSERVAWDDPKLSKFVYFPMPYEPERTSNPDGGDFYEAMDALITLRAFVPNDVAIFVKEHPSQFSEKLKGFQGRSPIHYQAIDQLHNVKLIDIAEQSSSLIEKSEFVACITGTAALEAALIGGRSIVFGSPWFYSLPGVHHFDDLTDYASLMAAPTATIDEISKAAKRLLNTTSIPTQAREPEAQKLRALFGDEWISPDWVDSSAKAIVDTMFTDFQPTPSR